ncbi:alpha/beta fold hydrolase [bacterium]|nr:alpha/beta fold hydrolase [bacterium]
MPLIDPSRYQSPFWLRGGHAQTLLPRLVRRVSGPGVTRERIATPDDDFLDVDWTARKSNRLAILSHGLEGCSRSVYVRGMMRALASRGWDCLAWNFRGCSGEINRQLRFYHSGVTDDLDLVVRHALKAHPANHIALIGFSLGGNVTLKFLGENPSNVARKVRAAVAISVPCHLNSSARKLAEPGNRIYMRYFLNGLAQKVELKARQFPRKLDLHGLHQMRTFAEFDEQITAPLHGFSSAEDYWTRSSSKQFLPAIRIPTLLLNARNDPFLTPECFPETEARQSAIFHLEAPESGGHVGFSDGLLLKRCWSEERAVGFLNAVIAGTN